MNDELENRVHPGDCRVALRDMEVDSIDAVVCDPPYGLRFMNKKWDYDVPAPETWAEILRVLKPGGHLLASSATRTYHRMAASVEDGGFEIRDMILWIYGSGFPKSQDVGKAIDKAAGAEREVVGARITGDGHITRRQNAKNSIGTFKIALDGLDIETAPATPEARKWHGWGTALKPACEPFVLARKPFPGPIYRNVLERATGALNVEGCRIAGAAWTRGTPYRDDIRGGKYGRSGGKRLDCGPQASEPSGRWPANIILDEEAAEELDRQSGVGVSKPTRPHPASSDCPTGNFLGKCAVIRGGGFHDSGGASRFFYVAKASRAERGAENNHPTVKPIALMRYLCRLVTPPGGLILDPFAGSGTTLIAAHLEGFRAVGVEVDPETAAMANHRIAEATRQGDLFHHTG